MKSFPRALLIFGAVFALLFAAACAPAEEATEEPTEVPATEVEEVEETEAPAEEEAEVEETEAPAEEEAEVEETEAPAEEEAEVEETEEAAEEAEMEATEEMEAMEATEEMAEEEMAMGGVDSLCLITDVGRVNDGTFNQYAHEGALQAQEDFDLEYTFIETEAETDYTSNIQTCIDEGFDVIVTVGFLIQDATAEAAAANPDIYFVGIDQFLVDGPENFVGIQFREDQAGFLVGVMAALVANENDSDVIAGVYGIDVPAVKRYRNGYEQGALYINPEWEVGTNILGAYADSFTDQAQGVSLAQQFIGEGASVIFGAGGPLGSAAIAEAASQGVYVIGVDQDEYFTTFDNGSGEGVEFLITSALKRVDQGVYDMVAAVVEGRMEDFPGGSNYLLDAERAGVGFAEAHDADVSEDITAQVEEVLTGLVDGSISTGVDPVSGDLEGAEEEMEEAPAEEAEATEEAE